MRMPAIAFLLAVIVAPAARADYSLVCGKVRDQGAGKSEIALVVDPDSLDTKVFLGGKELPKDSFIAKGGAGNRWDVTLFDAKGDVKDVFELLEKPAQAQRYMATAAGKRVKLGAAKKCLLTDTTEKPASAAAPKAN